MNVSFEDIGRISVTFGQEGCEGGLVFKIGGNGLVVPCADGEKFCGIVEHVRGNHAAVQVAGFAEVSITGAVSVGYVNLCADGTGGVKAGTGKEYLVVSVNENAKTAVIKL